MRLIYLILFLAGIYLLYAILPTYLNKLGNRVRIKGKSIMLTFDDGPDPRYTGSLLDVLKENEIKATFFVVVKKALQHPQIIQRMLDEGHTVGLHSGTHQNALLTTPFQVKRDFEQSMEIFQSYHWNIRFYRPPWGHINLATLYFTHKYHLKMILWTVMAEDWQKNSDETTIFHKLTKRTKSGSVICLHDSGEGSGGAVDAPLHTISALKSVLPLLLLKGYQFVTPKE